MDDLVRAGLAGLPPAGGEPIELATVREAPLPLVGVGVLDLLTSGLVDGEFFLFFCVGDLLLVLTDRGELSPLRPRPPLSPAPRQLPMTKKGGAPSGRRWNTSQLGVYSYEGWQRCPSREETFLIIGPSPCALLSDAEGRSTTKSRCTAAHDRGACPCHSALVAAPPQWAVGLLYVP